MGDLLLTFSALSESVWFSFLSHFLVSVPWLLSFLFPFLIKVVLLRKKSHTESAWKTLQLGQYTSFFSSILLLSVLILQKFIQSFSPSCLSPFSSFLYPASHHFSFSFRCSVFHLLTFLCTFAKHILLSYLLFLLKCLKSSSYVDLLFCYLLYLSMPSLVCFVVNLVLVSHLLYLVAVFSLLPFPPFWCLLMHFLICQFSSVSSPQNSVCRREWLLCLCPHPPQFLPGVWSISFPW